VHRDSGNHTAIEVVSRQRLLELDREQIAQLARAVVAFAAPGARCEVTIAFVRDAAIRRLNRQYRGRNHATDVLSFPGSPNTAAGADEVRKRAPSRRKVGIYLGDVVISTDTAVRQAGEARHTVEREISELVIHGVLHLCGYDHETDAGEMNRKEVSLRRKLLGGRRHVSLTAVAGGVDI
jgi:probable rRNA maturation factor